MRRQIDLLERQTRVGIIANPAIVRLPAPAPSNLLSRWPDLRSPRRLRQYGTTRPAAADPVSAGHALAEFALELRQRPNSRGLLGRLAGMFARGGENGQGAD